MYRTQTFNQNVLSTKTTFRHIQVVIVERWYVKQVEI